MLRRMAVIEFELVREINAPIEAVFTRLADIEGHNDWMPKKGSMLRRTEQTSPGEPGVGTTYVDDTSVGKTPGEIQEFDRPTRLVYHWWDKTKAGKTKVEGWPGYTLEAKDADTTVVRHSGRLRAYGAYRIANPIFRRMAVKERTAVVDALKASFES